MCRARTLSFLALLTSGPQRVAAWMKRYPAVNTQVPCARGFAANEEATLYQMRSPVGNYTLCLRPKQFIDKQVINWGEWPDCEPLVVKADMGSNFVDVGANIGACSAWMLGAGHFVTSFEPVDATFAALSAAGAATLKTLGNHGAGNFRAIQAALSAEPGNATIHIEPRNTGNSLVAPSDGWKPPSLTRSQTYETQVIRVSTLDDEIRWPVDVLKIDAQGFEVRPSTHR